MVIAVILFFVLVGVGVLMLLGSLPNGVDIIKFVTPSKSGIVDPDTIGALCLIVVLLLALWYGHHLFMLTYHQPSAATTVDIIRETRARVIARLAHLLDQGYRID